MERVVVAGVGIHPFGRFEADYRSWEQSPRERRSLTLASDSTTWNSPWSATSGGDGQGPERHGPCRAERPSDHQRGECVRLERVRAVPRCPAHRERSARHRAVPRGREAPRGFIAASGYSPWQIEAGLGVNPSTSPSPRKSCSRRPTPRSRTSPSQCEEPRPRRRQPQRHVPKAGHS